MATREFTREDVLKIRELAAQGHSAPLIARLYPDFALETIRRVIRRETYREIGAVAPELERRRVVGRLEGEAPPVDARPLTELEQEAMKSLERLRDSAGEATPHEPDPVAEFLGIRKAPDTTTK